MQIAIDAAGFSPGEADQLRQAMGSKRSRARMAAMRDRLMAGMAERGIVGETAEEIAPQARGVRRLRVPREPLGELRLPRVRELVDQAALPGASSRARLLNAQPMGFYSPHTIVRDAVRHGVQVLGPCIERSRRDCTLEPRTAEAGPIGQPRPGWHADPSTTRVRVGLRYVRGLPDALLDRIDAERAECSRSPTSRTSPGAPPLPSTRSSRWPPRARSRASTSHVATRCGPPAPCATRAHSSTVRGVAHVARHRHRGGGAAVAGHDRGRGDRGRPLGRRALAPIGTPPSSCAPGSRARGAVTVEALRTLPDRTVVEVGGVVTHRQQPETANGIVFLNLEDETGLVNIICTPDVWKRFRKVARTSPALCVRGLLERRYDVINVMARRIEPLASRRRRRPAFPRLPLTRFRWVTHRCQGTVNRPNEVTWWRRCRSRR